MTVSGKVQARRAAGLLIEEIGRENLKNIIFLSSNFTRARETAVETLKVTGKYENLTSFIYIIFCICACVLKFVVRSLIIPKSISFFFRRP